MCTIKEDGGLRFKKLTEFNLAMLSKQACRLIIESNPLVSKFMLARYYPQSDFLNASLGSNPSYVRRSIFQAQTMMKQCVRRRIGDGMDTRVCKVPWLPDANNGYLITEAP